MDDGFPAALPVRLQRRRVFVVVHPVGEQDGDRVARQRVALDVVEQLDDRARERCTGLGLQGVQLAAHEGQVRGERAVLAGVGRVVGVVPARQRPDRCGDGAGPVRRVGAPPGL